VTTEATFSASSNLPLNEAIRGNKSLATIQSLLEQAAATSEHLDLAAMVDNQGQTRCSTRWASAVETSSRRC
jgi:hypothetical protein